MSWRNPGEAGRTLTFDHNERGWFSTIPVYHFELTTTPLQWVTPAGAIIEPCRDFMTDGGSVPWIVTCWIDRLLCPDSFCLHDSSYKFGYWWQLNSDGTAFKRFCTRTEADDMLFDSCRAEGATAVQQRAIYAGVRAGGWRPWGQYRRLDAAK